MDESDTFGNDPNIFAECVLERGFYPENLPPVFSITNFHEAAIGPLDSSDYITTKPTEPCSYSASKRGSARRSFELPNPAFMLNAAIFFNQHRTPIFEHLQSTNDSLSIPKFHEDGRPLRISSSSEFHRVRRQRLATSRYIVRTDISRYFHSIYTHSIPWALHGKSKSKKDRKVESSDIFGNRIDHIFRQAQDGQTVGIPVGPDFSRFISEIIGKAIDSGFRERFGDQCVFIRHVDDIFIGADDYDEANRLLKGVQDAVQAYQLDLNERKTSVVPTNLDLEEFWPVQIRREIEDFHGSNPKAKGSRVGHDFVYFLDEVVRIANSHKDDGVIKYALRKMDDSKIWDSYWSLVEPFLVRVAINFPHCWDYVSRIASWRHRSSGIDTKYWSVVINKSLARHGLNGNDSEVVWALWLAKEIGVQIELKTLESILERCGALSALIALDTFSSVKHSFSFPKSKLLDRIGDQPMLGPDWILSYEADRLFGFKLKSKNLNGYVFGSELYDNNTEFYDRDAVPTVFEGADDPADVEGALEDAISFYDDDQGHLDDDGNDEDEF